MSRAGRQITGMGTFYIELKISKKQLEYENM